VGDFPAPTAPSLTGTVLEMVGDWCARKYVTVPQGLLVTDAYSTGWRARALEPGPQPTYQVLPADHTLRAIPLAAGKHHLILEYWPMTVPIGFAVTGVAMAGYLVAWGIMLMRGKSRHTSVDSSLGTVPT
jgi:hypothetical protein